MEELYLSSKNKDTDQLLCNLATNMRFCFLMCKSRYSHVGPHFAPNYVDEDNEDLK